MHNLLVFSSNTKNGIRWVGLTAWTSKVLGSEFKQIIDQDLKTQNTLIAGPIAIQEKAKLIKRKTESQNIDTWPRKWPAATAKTKVPKAKGRRLKFPTPWKLAKHHVLFLIHFPSPNPAVVSRHHSSNLHFSNTFHVPTVSRNLYTLQMLPIRDSPGTENGINES